MCSNTPAPSATTQIDLSAMKPGLAPDDFAFSRTGGGDVGEWRVVDDPTASNRRVIAQTNADPTDYRFPLAVYQRVSVKNVDVKMRFKPVSGRVDQAGGIAVRLTTPDDYYVVRANALEDNVRFYRVVKGKREELNGATPKSPPTNGMCSSCGPREIGSRSLSTASNFSRPKTIPSSEQAEWDFGRRPTA
jgi:hypothetical protein